MFVFHKYFASSQQEHTSEFNASEYLCCKLVVFKIPTPIYFIYSPTNFLFY